MPNRTEPLPLDAIRDLLGLVRALYRVEGEGNADSYRLARLASVGLGLQRALELGSDQPDVGSAEHQAAWKQAEQACSELPGALPMAHQAQTLLNSARGAVMRRR